MMNTAKLKRVAARRAAALCRLHWLQSGYCTGRELTQAECWFNLWDRRTTAVARGVRLIDTLVANFKGS